MSIAELLAVTKTRRQARRPWTEERTQRVQHSCTTDGYSATGKKEIMAFAATWMDLGNIREKKRNMVWYCLFVKSKKKKNDTEELICKTNKLTDTDIKLTDTDIENELTVTSREGLADA